MDAREKTLIELHYQYGLVDDPYGVGQVQLRITEDGAVSVSHQLGKNRRAWSGQAEPAVFETMTAGLGKAGFPHSPGQAPLLVPGTLHYTFTRKNGDQVESITLPNRVWPAYQEVGNLALVIVGQVLGEEFPRFKAAGPKLVANVVEIVSA